MNPNLRALAGSLGLAFALTAPGQTNPPADAQQLVDAWRARQRAGAIAAALVSEGQTRFYFAGSISDERTNLPDADTFFEIGSITKGFTGLLLADQIRTGVVKPDDSLAERLIDWPARTNSPAGAIRLIELATHRAGLPRLPGNMDASWMRRHGGDPYADYDTARLYEWLDGVKPKLEAGGRPAFLYSNVGFAILGHALAVAGRKPYETLLTERVLRPLGLTNTVFRLSAGQRTRLAPGHHGAQAVPNWGFQVFASAGGLRSTACDLAGFVSIMADLRDNPLREIGTTATAEHAPESGRGTIGYGWIRTPRDRGLLIWHNGGTGGYRSFVGWYPEHRIGVVVLASIDESVDKLGTDLLDTLLPPRR